MVIFEAHNKSRSNCINRSPSIRHSSPKVGLNNFNYESYFMILAKVPAYIWITIFPSFSHMLFKLFISSKYTTIPIILFLIPNICFLLKMIISILIIKFSDDLPECGLRLNVIFREYLFVGK